MSKSLLSKNPLPKHTVSLRQVNSLLLVLIVVLNGYIIAAPLWPRVTFWWQAQHTSRRAELTKAIHTPAVAAQTSQPNSLIIPAMMLQSPTLEGPESNWFNLLKAGIWRWPASSTPDKGGNTVFLAHRFSYTGPHGAFYYLDKLKTGDEIGVVWDNKTYTYKVVSSREVPPTETSIENNTTDARLTLFTCTPLWHPVNRLVVVAELEKQS
jgi:LPXTG-site transpeptidase (sortase) family protein